MSGYLQRFIDKACDVLIDGHGEEFLTCYYDYIDDIYNYRIPVRDIATKGNIKKSLQEYINDCSQLTKSGSKKSRQAWYELAIREGVSVNPGDIIYYVNTGTKKSETDAKRVTHQYVKDPDNPNETVELNGKIKSRILKDECAKRGVEKKTLKTKDIKEILAPYIVREEDEVILNCKLVPFEVIENENDLLCSDVPDLEYNVDKYIDQFNNRIRPLLVCFHPNIRDQILIKNPKDRKFWTKEEAELVSGYPMKPGDQDTYEALMTPERKEIEFWLKIGERPPFVDECGIQWEKLVEEYKETVKRESDELFQEENKKYLEALENLTQEDIDAFEDEGELPKSITDIVTLSPKDMKFYFIRIPDMTPSTGGNIFDDIRISMQEHGIETEAFVPELED
jgi:type I site-specific restriction endonuclease